MVAIPARFERVVLGGDKDLGSGWWRGSVVLISRLSELFGSGHSLFGREATRHVGDLPKNKRDGAQTKAAFLHS